MFVPMNDKFVFMTVRTETKRPQQFRKMQQTDLPMKKTAVFRFTAYEEGSILNENCHKLHYMIIK